MLLQVKYIKSTVTLKKLITFSIYLFYYTVPQKYNYSFQLLKKIPMELRYCCHAFIDFVCYTS